ncbi:hypothetical protein PsorP6_017198 [Peronosclerospora sorghi]|uniref:Uncharacterized protein n=1 Tax=Peronosclerospora sorghi TaxID=230839 RepID=A0ACC0WDU2_9STRA|nr:hypothetical protein PsorP6_017198 [Peronosclerospora sorghi]
MFGFGDRDSYEFCPIGSNKNTMVTDGIAADEIRRQMAARRMQVEGSRGVMAYLVHVSISKDKGKPSDVNKTFLASTIRSVTSHNQRQEEDQCWTLRRMERKLSKRRRSRSRSRRSRDRETWTRTRRCSWSRSPSRHRKRRRQTTAARRGGTSRDDVEKREDQDMRRYWADKKMEKTRKMWKHLHSEGTVSMENAPDFSSEDFDDEDDKATTTNLSSVPHGKQEHFKQDRNTYEKKEKHKKTRPSRW